jgi:glucans biosynthesis protein
MLPVSRRRLLRAATALAAARSTAWADPATPSGPPLGPPSRFSFEALKARAAASSRRPYAAPAPGPDLTALDYDALAKVLYRPEKTLWPDAPGGGVRFFPQTAHATRPVRIHVVEGGQARAVIYSPGLFEVGAPSLLRPLAAASGFSGFRVMNADGAGDWLAFQGASYFRSACPFNQYGLSARGLALDTAVAGPESFPDFTEFWLERSAAGGLIVYAALEGEDVAGAYRIAHRRGPAGLTQDIDCALFFRKSVARLGVAPLTSMFWYGENSPPALRDWRPEIHDSDGLAIWTGAGERIWRPLIDPPRVVTNTFSDQSPRGFGLVQRDRAFDHYQDDGVFYDRRPSAWVEPVGDWGPGSVELVEIPTNDETNDNIVAFWMPATPVKAGDALAFSYRLSWISEEPASGLARAVDTRIGLGGRPGLPRPPNARKLVVDFDGASLAGLARDSDVTAVVTADRGRVENAVAYPVVGTTRWRLMADVTITDPDSADLRAFMVRAGQPISETWTCQFFSRP